MRDDRSGVPAGVHIGLTKYERLCQPSFLVLAIALNIPPAVVGLYYEFTTGSCQYYFRWLLTNTAMCIANIVAACYAVCTIRTNVRREEEKFEAVAAAAAAAPAAVVGDEESHDGERHESSENDAATRSEQHRMSHNSEERLDHERKEEQQHIVPDSDTEQTKTTCDDFSVEVQQHPKPTTPSTLLAPSASSNATKVSTMASEAGHDQDERSHRHSCFKRMIRLRTVSSNRIRHLVCYNGLFATYAILFVFWLFWLASGVQLERSRDSEDEDDVEGCNLDHDNAIIVAVACGYAYVAVVIVCLLASYVDTK